MSEWFEITPEILTNISKLAPKHRKLALRALGEMEWARCSEDLYYWMDESQHPTLGPYVYTKDPHPMYVCNGCQDGLTYHFNQRAPHLLETHKIELNSEGLIRGHFRELPTIRPFTMMPYVQPIAERWLQDQFVLVKKSRDMMMTWIAVTLYTWDTIFHKGRQNIFQSETSLKSSELVERAYFIWSHQPKFLKLHHAEFGAGTAKSGRFRVEAIDSEILGFPQGPDQIRQFHPSGFFQDEAAFQMEAGDAFSAIKPAIQAGGRFTAVSSANPSWFHLVCEDMESLN